MRLVTLKVLCTTGVILASVLLLHLKYSNYGTVHSSRVSRRQKNKEIVLSRKGDQKGEQSKRLVNSEPNVSKDICVNTTFPNTAERRNFDQNDKISKRFNDRSNVLMTACNALKERETYSNCDEAGVKINLKYSLKTNIVYCAIEKTGSTFWKRILQIVGGHNNVSNPIDIKPIKAEYSQKSFSDMQDRSWDEIEEVFKSSKSIMFVRDPHARLFSAWLDKFYSPNTIYWNSTGRAIARSQRRTTEVTCTSDITFTEFVNYTVDEILSGNKCVDRHFSPSYKHCNPCKLKFDFIGKYETMKDDTLFILNALDLTEKVRFSDFENDAATDAIKDATDWVFYQQDKLSECGLTFRCALFRVWQRLQSRGLISYRISFPFSSARGTITPDDFETALRSAHDETDPEEAIFSRKEALSQAFSSLPENVRQKFTKAFGRDFDIFGYVRDTDTDYHDSHMNTYFHNSYCPLDL